MPRLFGNGQHWTGRGVSICRASGLCRFCVPQSIVTTVAPVLAPRRRSSARVCSDTPEGLAKKQCASRLATATVEEFASAPPTRSPVSVISATPVVDARRPSNRAVYNRSEPPLNFNRFCITRCAITV
ncbi:unnamed protein product [Nippostrongylus brasiliensis]|uniref:Uncharacterized protein n=1 Tax=Nippostrongylus brasiliensis TaxID=27835 RepID=A0A0N4XD03_NIPBR|nr:unnamed protein product [Nippostrongylus brasiliensis]